MSLKGFHILFVTLSSALAFGFGVWGLRRGMAGDDDTLLTLGIASLVAGVALVAYGFWFLRKIRTPEEERKRRRSRFKSVPAIVVVALLSARDAGACTVCYGDAQGPMIDAARMGVWLLFGLVLAVQVSFASFFIVLWKRARDSRKRQSLRGPAHKGVA